MSNKKSNSDRTSAAFVGFLQAVLGDVYESLRLLETSDNQFNRRNFVRCVFAGIESVLFELRRLSLERSTHDANLYSDAEKALLREENYGLDDRGNVSVRPAYARLEDSLKFTLSMYFRRGARRFSLDVSGEGWGNLKKSLLVRHRITHPKRADELDISQEELRNVKAAYVWFVRAVILELIDRIELFQAEKKMLQAKVKRLKLKAEKLMSNPPLQPPRASEEPR